MHLFSKENIWSNPQQFPAYSNDPVIQTRIIILWSELFPKKRREKIQGEILQSIFEYRIQWCFHISTRTTVLPVILQELQDSFEYSVFLQELQELQCFHTQSSRFPVIPCYSTYRINSSTRILQEILQLQGSSRADQYKASSSNCSPCIQAFYTAESSHKAPTAFQGHTAQAGFQ